MYEREIEREERKKKKDKIRKGNKEIIRIREKD